MAPCLIKRTGYAEMIALQNKFSYQTKNIIYVLFHKTLLSNVSNLMYKVHFDHCEVAHQLRIG